MQYYLVFFSQQTMFRSYINLGENNNLTNELIIKWLIFKAIQH